MINRWNDSEAQKCINQWGEFWGKDLALLTYASRIVGREADLALHGGGNTSIKCVEMTQTGMAKESLSIKASGVSMETITPDQFPCLDLRSLKKMRAMESMTDDDMADKLRECFLRPSTLLPSIETLMHAFIDHPCVIHTHPTAILSLINRQDGELFCREALGDKAGIIPYVNSGLSLAKCIVQAAGANPVCYAIVITHHGLVTWGNNPKQAYDATIEMTSRAEQFLELHRRRSVPISLRTSIKEAHQRSEVITPIARELLSSRITASEGASKNISLVWLISDLALNLLHSPLGKEFIVSAPITPCYLVLTKSFSLWVENLKDADTQTIRGKLNEAITVFSIQYGKYIERNASRIPHFTASKTDLLPRVLALQGIGILCAGTTEKNAMIVRDITEQMLCVKKNIHETGGIYRGLSEEHLFDMEFRALQRAKVA